MTVGEGARKLWGALIANARHIVRDSHVLSNEQREHLIHQVLIFVIYCVIVYVNKQSNPQNFLSMPI